MEVSDGFRRVLNGVRKILYYVKKVSGRCQMISRRCQMVTGRCQLVSGRCQMPRGCHMGVINVSDSVSMETNGFWKASDDVWRLSDIVKYQMVS